MPNFLPGQVGYGGYLGGFYNDDDYSDITMEDITAAYTEMQLDLFRNDPLYIAAFEHGDFGDIDEATFETFGEVKTYIADTIFATDHIGNTEDSSDNYTPSGDEPAYLDVSEYYQTPHLPELYREPEPPSMPGVLKQYNYNASRPSGLISPQHADYPGDVSNYGEYAEHTAAQEALNQEETTTT